MRVPCRCASLDGDADRLVYFQGLPGGQLQLLDGDRIAVLAALLIRDILDRLSHDAASPSVGHPQHLWLHLLIILCSIASLSHPSCVGLLETLQVKGPCCAVVTYVPIAKQVGIVQTAYANGASSQYIREQLRLETAVTATGVKHLHAAAERFDIGIYFEANGHGTVLFRPALIERLHKVRANPSECSAAVCRD